MEPFKTEKDLFLALQGYWESTDGAMGFQIQGHKLTLNGGMSGLGIPGLDNADGAPLLLKWHADLGKWQIFCASLQWFLVFLEDVSSLEFTTTEYDEETGAFLPSVSYQKR